ncbi:hypothetical protein KF840_11460 [bacterium]|nr:hypothetical protein [bacterium]
MRRAVGVVLAFAVAIWCLPAIGIDTTLRFGRLVKIRDKDGTAGDQVIVKFVKESGLITTLPSPLCPAASTVRLKTDTKDLLIDLDCSFWSASGGSGYAYKDASGSAGGVTTIKLASKPTGGKLLIKLKGDGYGVDAISGPIGFLEVQIVADGGGYCGRFAPPSSPFIKNDPDQILIKGPSSACLQPTPTITLTPTVTETPTPSRTPTTSSTPTITLTASATATATITLTPSSTRTATFTVPPGSTATVTPTLAPATAFRVDSLSLRDPHLIPLLFGVSCFDVTDPPGVANLSANGQIATLIGGDSDMDGLFDLSLLALFRPLQQPPLPGADIQVTLGDCTTADVCSLGANTPSTVTYGNQGSGSCGAPLPGTSGINNATPYSPPITNSGAPCFGTDPATITFPIGLFELPLEDVRASGTYVGGPPANQIMNGLLVGFLSEAAADNIFLPDDPTFQLVGLAGKPVSVALPGGTGNCASHTAKDIGPDGVPGWYFYLNFTAHQVTWSGP